MYLLRVFFCSEEYALFFIHSTFRVYHYGLKFILFQRVKSNIVILLLKLFCCVRLGGFLSSEKIYIFF